MKTHTEHFAIFLYYYLLCRLRSFNFYSALTNVDLDENASLFYYEYFHLFTFDSISLV